MDKIRIEKTKPIKLAYIEHIGEYSKVPYGEYIQRLFEWAKENKARPGFKSINVYHDDPQEKNPADCKTWVGIPIRGNVKPDNEVKIEDLPATDIASYKFRGTSDQIKDAYVQINKWMDENGYEWNGPSMEVCSKKPKEKNGQILLYSTIQVPIKKMR